VIVHSVQHDPDNETLEGRCSDGARPLHVLFAVDTRDVERLGLVQHGPTRAPAEWTDADADAARLALELECLLTDMDVSAAPVSRWWDSALEALSLHRKRLAAATEPS
jgi:hypothetical protein